MAQFLGNALEAYSLSLFTRAGGWNADDVYELLENVRDELSSNRMHIYTHLYVYSQLPGPYVC